MEHKHEVNPVRMELRYVLEDDFRQAIASGNRKQVEQLVAYRTQKFPDPDCCPHAPASDKLRSCKNRMLSCETICRLGARQGGVPALALYSLSARYTVMIEDATSVQFLYEKLFAQMVLEYVDLVLEFSLNTYSPVIQQLVVYICSHIGEDVTLTKLALIHHINASHLSRKFRQETGMTLSAYINRQRIGLAKLYLENGHTDLYELAGQLGFSNPDYMGKVFKRHTGQTLTHYIKGMQVRRCSD